MSNPQLIAAALRELLADTPDPTEVASILSDVPAEDVAAVLAALTHMVGYFEYRAASLRVKAGAR
jgi:hypothetical protein